MKKLLIDWALACGLCVFGVCPAQEATMDDPLPNAEEVLTAGREGLLKKARRDQVDLLKKMDEIKGEYIQRLGESYYWKWDTIAQSALATLVLIPALTDWYHYREMKKSSSDNDQADSANRYWRWVKILGSMAVLGRACYEFIEQACAEHRKNSGLRLLSEQLDFLKRHEREVEKTAGKTEKTAQAKAETGEKTEL